MVSVIACLDLLALIVETVSGIISKPVKLKYAEVRTYTHCIAIYDVCSLVGEYLHNYLLFDSSH